MARPGLSTWSVLTECPLLLTAFCLLPGLPLSGLGASSKSLLLSRPQFPVCITKALTKVTSPMSRSVVGTWPAGQRFFLMCNGATCRRQGRSPWPGRVVPGAVAVTHPCFPRRFGVYFLGNRVSAALAGGGRADSGRASLHHILYPRRPTEVNPSRKRNSHKR